MSERETPETDAKAFEIEEHRGSTREIPTPDGTCVDASFARKLERERDEAREALAPFAKYMTALEGLGHAPKEGALWGCHTPTGDAEITVEDLKRAREITEAPTGGPER